MSTIADDQAEGAAPVPPTKFQQYADAADKVQARCACIRWEARECYEARNYRRIDDLDDGRRPEWDDSDCECSCHDEIREIEEDIYGPAEYPY